MMVLYMHPYRSKVAVKTVPLVNGGVAIVDDEWLPTIEALGPWRGHRKSSGIYAYVSLNNKVIYMHCLIAGDREGLVVDHINGFTLDNQRHNLRHILMVENLSATMLDYTPECK